MARTLKIGITTDIDKNRHKFLSALRSGKYTKGVATSDSQGKPVVVIDGYCACAVMIHELSPVKLNYRLAREALGITGKDCAYIQTQLNDTPLTFPQIADRIENEVFYIH
jgi:hypothetical protein